MIDYSSVKSFVLANPFIDLFDLCESFCKTNKEFDLFNQTIKELNEDYDLFKQTIKELRVSGELISKRGMVFYNYNNKVKVVDVNDF